MLGAGFLGSQVKAKVVELDGDLYVVGGEVQRSKLAPFFSTVPLCDP